MDESEHDWFVLNPAAGMGLFLVAGLCLEDGGARFIKQHVRPNPGARVLDIGCGTAQILDVLKDVHYVGYDLSPEYIARASTRYGDRGQFCVNDVRSMYSTLSGQFDIVLAVGLLHHLDDNSAGQLFHIAHEVLVKGGRLITIDPSFAPVSTHSPDG